MKRRRIIAGGIILALGAAAGLGWTFFSKQIRRWIRPVPEPWHGLFQDPEGMAVDAEGNFYVADEDLGEFTMLDRTGRILARFRSIEGLDGVLTAGDGMVVAAPRRVIAIGDHKLVELTIDGDRPKLARVIGAGRFRDPEGLARDDNGDLYATDEDNRRIHVFDREGKLLRSWPVSEDPEAICVAHGRVYVTFSKANLVQAFDKQGAVQLTFGRGGSGPGEFDVPDFICLSPRGELYITDQKNNRIQVFDRDGKFLLQFGKRGKEGGEFEDPEDLAFDPEGNLVVSDGGNHRLQVLTPQGRFLRQIR